MPSKRGLRSIVPEPAVDHADVQVAATRMDQLLRALASIIHVEFEGFYSLPKLGSFQEFEKRGVWHQLLTLGVATLPTCLVVCALELLVLEDPTLGWSNNPTFFARETLRAWILGIAGNIQVGEMIPKLRQPWHLVLLIGFLQIVPYTATLVVIAECFHVFPVPFSNVMPILPVILISVVIRYCFIRRVLERYPDVKPEHQRMERLMGFTFTLLIVYSIYGFAFRSVSARYQVPLSVALYGIKYAVKVRMWRLCHIQAHHDYAAESGACGAHLFHVLFMTSCLQSARSNATLAIVLVFGITQDLLSLRSIRRLSSDVSALVRSFENDFCAGTFCSPFSAEWTASVMKDADRSDRASVTGSAAHLVTRLDSLQQIVAVIARPGVDLSTIRVRRARVTHAIAHLMHCREVVLLHMFVDLFVPVFYLAYVGLLLVLPSSNRRYVDNLADLDVSGYDRLCRNVAVLVACKLATLAALCALLRSRSQPAGLHQLAFVARSQRWTMQPWFVMSVLQIINFPLVHMGNDLSFRFAWIGRQHVP